MDSFWDSLPMAGKVVFALLGVLLYIFAVRLRRKTFDKHLPQTQGTTKTPKRPQSKVDRALGALGVFIIILFLSLMVIAIGSKGALKHPDAGPLRTLLLSGALLFSVLAGWLRWKLPELMRKSKGPVDSGGGFNSPEPLEARSVAQPNTAKSHRPVAFTPPPIRPDHPDLAVHRNSPIIVSRKARLDENGWAHAKSWFGGLPKLGSLPWPTTSNDVPLIFAAQFDLAEIAAVQPHSPLPKTGSLAIFFGDGGAAYIPQGQDTIETTPPASLPPALDLNGEIMPENPSPFARISFPRWPAEFTSFSLSSPPQDLGEIDREEYWYEQLTEQVGKAFPKRQYFLAPSIAFPEQDKQTWPFWWHGVHLYVDQLNLAQSTIPARVDKLRQDIETAKQNAEKFATTDQAKAKNARKWVGINLKNLEAVEMQKAAFPELVKAVENFADGRYPWAELSAQEKQTFESFIQKVRKDFDKTARYNTASYSKDLLTQSLRAMATGDSEAYAALPVSVKQIINRDCRLPSSNWHQMFGHGIDIQGYAVDSNSRNHLLLQLTYDDMLSWEFGDMGAFQFWISPEDLATQNWSAVKMTFECH